MKDSVMPTTRIKYLRIFIAITFCVFGVSQSAFATTCTANESPTANCTNLEINGSNLTITNPSGVIVEADFGGGIVDNGSNNSIVNNGEVRGPAVPQAGSWAVAINGSLSTLTNSGVLGEQANSGIAIGGSVLGASITTLSNTGTIASGVSYAGGYAIENNENSQIFSFTNSGYVGSVDGGLTARSNTGVNNNGTITQLNNSSTGVMVGVHAAINNGVTGTITTLTNSGKIGTGDGTAALSYAGIINSGVIEHISNTNSGVIIGSSFGIFNSASGNIGQLENNGLISSSIAFGIDNVGTITNITNYGTISSETFAIFNADAATIASLTNRGTMVGIQGSAIANEGLISNLTNSGVMESQINSSAIYNGSTGTITTLTNTGTIRNTGSSDAISNEGTIGSIINSGTITSPSSIGIANNGTSTLQTITNTGTITGGFFGIFNWGDATIVTLNNGQGAGNPAGALTYDGKLPTNYNIIVNSPTSYGKLSASSLTGSTTFGIYSSSTLTKGTYTSVLSGFAAGTNVSTTSGMFNGTGWQLIESGDGTGIWNLIADYSATNTLASVQQNSNGLATVYNQQTAAYQAALSYDCQVYDENNLCVSVGGRYTYAGPSPSSNQQAGLVILGYKPVQTFRVGAFADQSVNISTPSGFSQSKTSPMWGFFAKWHKNKDETGLGVQASVVTSSSSLTATRPQLFNTEAGSGTTQFNGQGYQLTTNYHQPVTNNTSVVPYLGLRYTRINAGAYTENTTATVTSPLSYNAMAQNTFSAIAGLGVRSLLAEKLTGTASVGIQQNLNYSMGNYAGTSNITGLESFSVQMPGNVNSMATATAGMFYDINKRERVGLNVLWQQQPFIATNTTTALATYTIGF